MNEQGLVYDQTHELDPEMRHYELDPKLKEDCIYLGNFRLCDLLLMNDANFPWFILVPRRPDINEIYQLSEEDQIQLIKESSALSENMQDIFAPDKINVAALGNVVRQLHVHHVARYQKDLAWPAPIWGKAPAKAYEQSQLDELIQRVDSLIEDSEEFTPA